MQNFVRFLKEVRQYWRLIALIGFLTLCTASLEPWPPLFIKYLTDTLSEQALRQHIAVNLAFVFFGGVSLAVGGAIFGFLLTYCVTLLSQRFKLDMRRKLYSHMQSLSLGFFEKARSAS